MKVLIAGAGIGGLTTAIALARDGHSVTVVERNHELSPVGAGIVIAPNAAHILGALGVELAARARALPSMEIRDARGQVMQRIDNALLAGAWGPTWALTRAELSNALREALPRSVELRLGAELTEVEVRPAEVSVHLGGEQRGFELLVGADGLHSKVRTLTLGEQRLRYSGVTCWRGLMPNPGFEGAVESWGGAARVGLVPLRDQRLYYYLVRTASERAPAPAWPEGFRNAFAEVSDSVPGLFEAMTEAPPLHHDLCELDSPVWGRERVALVGDAAHAMTPNQGQGAAMAIEDGFVLARLVTGGGVENLISRYAAARQARVRRVQLDSRRLGAVAHWAHPMARWVRDGLMRLAPASLSDRQYIRVVQPGVALVRS